MSGIRYLKVHRGGHYELTPVKRNPKNERVGFYNLFIRGEGLCVGCSVKWFYSDHMQEPFDVQELGELQHTEHGDFMTHICSWHIRRTSFYGKFHIIGIVSDTDNKEICRMDIDIIGQKGKLYYGC